MNKVKQTFLLTLIISVLALNNPGRLYAALPGDLNSDGVVSIAEVQKVINSFLGLEGDSPSIAVNPMYGSPSIFMVTGKNLDRGIIATSSGACSNLKERQGGSASTRSYWCVPSSVGSLNITISSASGGTVLSQSSFMVPNPQVTMETTMGTIVVELNPTKAPITVKNFLQYVKGGFYDNTVIHRAQKGFVVQGGGYESSLSSYPTWTTKAVQKAIVLEPTSVTGLSNTQGTIAMARGSELNTATSQFFFNTVNNNPNTGAYNGTNLDLPTGKGYAVFGSIVQGMSFVQAIENVAVGTVGSYGNVPTTMITVTAATQTQ